MGHLIENMFYLGETPWHGLGTPLQEVPSIEEALELSGMNFEVTKVPTMYDLGPVIGEAGIIYKETGHFVTVRSDTGKPIGNVGKKYEVLQNRDAFAPFEVLQDYGYKFETAGVIDEGKKVWILAKTPDTFQVGDDAIQGFVLLYTSHDGSSGSCFRDTSIRVVCNNTLTWALNKKGGYEYKLRHTSSINSRIKDLTDKIEEHKGNVSLAMDHMNRFVDVEMTPESLKLYIEAVMPWLKNRHKESVPELGIFVRNRAKPVYDTITDLFYNGKGNKGRTLWDAYNAVAEYHDHVKNHKDWVKGTHFGASHRDKMNAYRIAEAMANHSSNSGIITYN